jgi:hypothetical protein
MAKVLLVDDGLPTLSRLESGIHLLGLFSKSSEKAPRLVSLMEQIATPVLVALYTSGLFHLKFRLRD